MLTVGAIVVVYDRTEFLHDALYSIYSQTHKVDQVVVVSNIPFPDTCEFFIGWNVFYFLEVQDKTLAGKVNTAAKLLDTDTMFILCDDDKIREDFVEKTVAKMEGEGVDIVYTDMEIVGIDPKIVEAERWTAECMEQSTVPFITSLVRKQTWNFIGGYANDIFADWNFWWSCFDHAFIAAHVKEPLFIYRTHEKQGSRTMWNGDKVEEGRRVAREKHEQRMACWKRFEWQFRE